MQFLSVWVKVLIDEKNRRRDGVFDVRTPDIDNLMCRYTVEVADLTVNQVPSGSGGSTPSRHTNFRQMG